MTRVRNFLCYRLATDPPTRARVAAGCGICDLWVSDRLLLPGDPSCPRAAMAGRTAPVCKPCKEPELLAAPAMSIAPAGPASSAAPRPASSSGVSDAQLKAAYETILRAIGEDPSREGLIKTPARAAKAMRALTSGYGLAPIDIARDALFTVDPTSDEPLGMVVVVSDVALPCHGVRHDIAFCCYPSLMTANLCAFPAARHSHQLLVRASLASILRALPHRLPAKPGGDRTIQARSGRRCVRTPPTDAGEAHATDCGCPNGGRGRTWGDGGG